MANDGVFDFYGLADVCVVTNGGRPTKVAIRAHLAVFSNDDIPFDHNAR